MRLTSRDFELLGYLKEQGVATAEQLTRGFFTSSDSFRKRISHLVRFGVIQSVPIQNGASEVPSRLLELKIKAREAGLDWQKMRLYRINPKVFGKSVDESPLSEPIFWQHQIGLNEIRAQLKGILPGGIFLSDPETKSEWARFNFKSEIPIPDLVWRKADIALAFEFERTNKGELRYFDRMSKYQRSAYQRVVYFANNESIAEVLRRCCARFVKVGVTPIANISKTFVGLNGVQSLNDFLVSGMNYEQQGR
jgi:hypothetical protein